MGVFVKWVKRVCVCMCSKLTVTHYNCQTVNKTFTSARRLNNLPFMPFEQVFEVIIVHLDQFI